MTRIYLDANGSSPALASAKAKILHALDLLGNPSSSHDHGRIMRALIDEARAKVAQAITAKEKQVIFTSGATEANRLFVDALVLKSKTQKLNVVMSPFEHPSLLKPAIDAHNLGYFDLKILDVDNRGHLVLPTSLAEADVVIACGAHNETGIIIPIDDIINKARPNALIMSDIAQSFSRIAPPHPRIDVLTCSAQKMGGFAGSGCIVIRGNAQSLQPPWLGGGQERGFRPGTESSLLIVAFGEAASQVEIERAAFQNLVDLKTYFETKLKECAPIKIIGEACPRLPNTSAVCFTKEDPDALRIACDLFGLSVGFGAACSGLAPEGSFALKRLGLNLREEKATVRFSLISTTTKDDIDQTIDRLTTRILTHKLRA